MDDGSIFMIVALVILVCMSAFFSSAETAYSSLNLIRLRSRADAGDRQAAKVLSLAERYDSLLSTILIGNNIVNIGASSIGTVLFTKVLGGAYGPTVSTIVMTLVVLTFGEITPKSMAKEMPESLALSFAPTLSVLVTVFTPLNWIFGQWKNFLAKRFYKGERDTITEGELVTMVSEAEKDGELTDRESELIRSAIEFDDVEVEEVLTPRVDVVAVADDISMEELADAFDDSGYSRLPVYHESIDNIIGVVHEKDYYAAVRKGKPTMDELITPISPTLYTTTATQISTLLLTLRESKHHMAVVVDEYGGTAGIITLEDILEELVGEIWDEHDDVVEDIRQQSDGSWLVSGTAGIDDVAEELSIRDKEEIDAIAISGLVQEKLGRLPKVGDHFVWGDCDGTVTRVSHRRVQEVRLTRRPPQEEPRKGDRREHREREKERENRRAQ